MTAKVAKQGGGRRKRKWMSKDNLQLLTMVLPAMIKVFLFSYLPLWGIVLAFEEYNYTLGPWKSKFVGFKNFEFFFKSNDAGRLLYNTLLMNSIFIIVGTAASVLLALFMYQVVTARKSLKFYQTVMFFPYFVSWVVAGIILECIIGSNGMLTSFLTRIGIPYSFYTSPAAWRIILPLCHIWKSGGYSCIIYYGVLVGTDTSLYDAAKIDGASSVQIMLRLQVPFLTPMIVLNTLAAVGNIFRADFGMFYFLPGAGNSLLFKTTDVIDTYVYRAIQGMGSLSMGTAVGLFQSAIGFLLILAANKLSRKYDPDFGLY